jgi:hypothetical protein
MTYRLLTAFRRLFEGKRYIHRNSTLGDQIAVEVYEDIYSLGRSPKFLDSVASMRRGVGPRNKTVSLARMRRGDGTLGELLDPTTAKQIPGYEVRRGAIATIDCGVEVKILNKAMIKQIDRVVNDLEKQVKNWKTVSPDLVSIAIVGINWAPYTVGYEGDRAYKTDGTKNKHPYQEAPQAEQHIVQRVISQKIYDEVLILRYRATNDGTYAFAWDDDAKTKDEYRAALIRLSKEIEKRF